MMVLRLGPPSSTTAKARGHPEDSMPDERGASPIDLSKKPVCVGVHGALVSVGDLTNATNNNNNLQSSRNHHNSILTGSRRSELFRNANLRDVKWLESKIPHTISSTGNGRTSNQNFNNNNEEEGSYSSPDSGLQRDSPGEEEELIGLMSGGKSTSPPFIKQGQGLIPLSLIRAKYNHQQFIDASSPSSPLHPIPHRTKAKRRDHGPEEDDEEEELNGDDDEDSSTKKHMPEIVLTKRARLEEMVTHIKKTTTPKERRHSGDDNGSSSGGDQVNSSDEIPLEDAPRDLRRTPTGGEGGGSGIGRRSLLREGLRSIRNKNDTLGIEMTVDEPFNLVCHKSRASSQTAAAGTHENSRLQFPNSPPLPPLTPDEDNLEAWKKKLDGEAGLVQSLSPSDLKLYGIDPENFQQQMQFQLTQAAMLGDPAGLMKALGNIGNMGNYPPWVYLGYYSQILQSFQAQEILRQYAMQSKIPSASQPEETSPSAPRNLGGSSGYNCRSPCSPASLSEGPTGIDSDSSIVGPNSSGSVNGKRAPRAMTGRHVRTGTGASPSTLQTLRQKIEERQRIKAQQLRHESIMNPGGKGKVSGKPSKKSKK